MKRIVASLMLMLLLPLVVSAEKPRSATVVDVSAAIDRMVTAGQKTPEMRWVDRAGPVHSLMYAGEEFQGKSTEVFAFYASPATLSDAPADGKYPAVVLIHGGGGTAFAEWVWLWAKRGYAAIAMDLSGSRPAAPRFDAETGLPVRNQGYPGNTRTRLENGGPNHGHVEKFDSIGGDVSDDWPFHAAASVIRAHSLIRSFDDVDSQRTAVTGISWGGYTTCLAASLDGRFKAAVPVYGCGFLHEGESVQKPSIDRLGDRRDDWVAVYDPGSQLSNCQVPILFVNGTNDVHYPLDSYQKSFDVVPGKRQMRIEVKMGHSHPAGWNPKEIGLFIDSYCRGGQSLPVPGALVIQGDRVTLPFTSDVPLKSASLHYTTDDGSRAKRNWHSAEAKIEGATITAPKPPAGANTWFISLTDQRDAMVTTAVQLDR